MTPVQRRGSQYLFPVFVVFLFVVGGLFIASFMLKPPRSETVGACTLEAKVCPDGSRVGRVPPRCDFEPCPSVTHDNVNSRNVPENVNTQSGAPFVLTLYDATSELTIGVTPVRLYVDNGTRCVTTPCPTNGRQWQGMTDGQGTVVIPDEYVDASMTMSVTGYETADLRISGRQISPGTWTLRLEPEP